MVRGGISSILRLQNVRYGTFLDYKLRSTHASRGNLVFIKGDYKVTVFIPIEIMLVIECYEVLSDFRIFNPVYFTAVLCHNFFICLRRLSAKTSAKSSDVNRSLSSTILPFALSIW